MSLFVHWLFLPAFRFGVERFVHYLPLAVYLEKRHIIDKFYTRIIEYDLRYGRVAVDFDCLDLSAVLAAFLRPPPVCR